MMIMKELNDCGIFNLVGIILSPIISMLILFITLNNEKKNMNEQLEKQKKQHYQNLKAMEKKHKQSLKQQREINRIEAMPYLILYKENVQLTTKKVNDKEILYFELTFVNKGNGTAIELKEKYIEKSEYTLGLMCKTQVAEYGCCCPLENETSVVKSDGKCEFEIYQNIDTTKNMKRNNDIVEFTILYKDMYFNKYEQVFKIIFGEINSNKKIEITRVATNSPILIDDEYENI